MITFPPPSPYSYYAPARVGEPAFPVAHDRLMSAAAAAESAWAVLDRTSCKALTIVPEDGLTAEEAAKIASR